MCIRHQSPVSPAARALVATRTIVNDVNCSVASVPTENRPQTVSICMMKSNLANVRFSNTVKQVVVIAIVLAFPQSTFASQIDSKPMAMPTNADSVDARYIAEAYIDALQEKSMDDLPLATDVTFSGPLLPEPIVGRGPVSAFLNRVAPALASVDVKSINTHDKGACIETEVVFASMPDRSLPEVACLSVNQGEITGIRLYFDPRPLIDDSETRTDES